MLSVVATIKIKDGKVDEAKAFLKELASETLANEEGTLAYAVHQRRDDPQTMVVYEKYESDEAFAIHGQNLASKGAKFAGVLAGAPEVVVLDEL
jgi:quinol monooxygenase YgiN